MSLPFGQVSHVPAQDGSGEPDVKGRCYSIRVVRFSAGATIAFDDINNKLTVLAASTYPFPPGGWQRIYLTGTITIEYSLWAGLKFEVSGGSPDGAGNQPVAGPAADGAGSGGSPVQVAGLDGLSKIRTIGVGVLGAAAPLNAELMGGKDGDGNLQPLPICGELAISPQIGLLLAAMDKGVNRSRLLSLDQFGRLLPPITLSQAFDAISPNAPGTGVGATVTLSNDFVPRRAAFVFESAGATGGTLDIYIQTSVDTATKWADVIHLPQILAGAALARWAVVLDASNPGNVPIAGLNTVDGTPTLAVNTTRNILGSRWRMVLVAGAGTTAGVNQVQAHAAFT